jgi:hypothetical protein
MDHKHVRPTPVSAANRTIDGTATGNFDTVIRKPGYSIGEVLGLVPIGRSKLYEEIGAKRLRITKCGRRTMILAPDLARWLTALRGDAK